jgi:hypothetical protein
VIVGSDPKRLSVSPYENSLSACSGLTTELRLQIRPDESSTRHDGLVNPTWKNRSNGVDTDLVQKGNARKEPVKGNYFSCPARGWQRTLSPPPRYYEIFLAFPQAEIHDRSQTYRYTLLGNSGSKF